MREGGEGAGDGNGVDGVEFRWALDGIWVDTRLKTAGAIEDGRARRGLAVVARWVGEEMAQLTGRLRGGGINDAR